MRLGLIPARGGSKRIPRKNILPFHGKPMIVRSIEAALACGRIDTVIVSTDDEEIAALARSAGAQVPFMRAAELSGDHATTLAVIADALEKTEAQGARVEALCCLYATAPFTTAADLEAAHGLLEESGASYVFAAAEFPYPIQRALRLVGGRAAMFHPEHAATRSQDLEPAFHDAGQFYWCRPEAVRAGRPMLGPDAVPYLMDRARVQDIDTPEDWAFAEKLFALGAGGAPS
ncbi:pseudaminic acid cytidylyltransferase [Aureimonas populi]|uniref:Pseudaminic acid cytidylyltransferase n=1 Tax=Aureimonas populi TaxID=1701758 RepID=A0ABW5CMK1_9HYPH|nr:pseudaminic acid cytidylyltransferase [Aureimonas populi]